MSTTTTSVLFVCLGNICRSPTAHGVFEALVREAGREQDLLIDSAGTGAWHVGEAPDRRAAAAARERGYQLDHLRARQVSVGDFERFDHILAMDGQNLADLRAIQPGGAPARLSLFLDYHPDPPFSDVPDPYYGGDAGFDEVLDLVEAAGRGLLAALSR